MRAIALLSFWKIRNSLRSCFTDPRKLVPILFLAAAMGFFVFVTALTGNLPRSQMPMNLDLAISRYRTTLDWLLALASLGLLLLSVSSNVLVFGKSDVDYLFSSPVSRRVVLLYRLPAEFASYLFQGLFFTYLVSSISRGFARELEGSANGVSAPAWVQPLAMMLFLGLLMNVGLFLSMAFPERTLLRRGLIAGVVVLVSLAIGVAWKTSGEGLISIAQHPVFDVLFYPGHLASEVFVATAMRQPFAPSLLQLGGLFGLSLIPMFVSNANWYEESITNTERAASLRTAAKSGYASLLAMQASKKKYKARRTYIVKPFGQGAMALVWAHLSAAAKRPWANIVLPALGGIGVGAGTGLVMMFPRGDLYAAGSLIAVLTYCGIFFMSSARTASEASGRRRELTSPLPISGRQMVLANLAVPILITVLFSTLMTVSFSISAVRLDLRFVVGLLLLFPVRIVVRMLIQYASILINPDLEDKMQQFLVQIYTMLMALPLLIIEVVAAIPGVLLRNVPVALLGVTVAETLILFGLLRTVGWMSDRAIATGESLKWRNLFGR